MPSSYSKISSILILAHFNLIFILIYFNAVMENDETESNVLLEGRGIESAGFSVEVTTTPEAELYRPWIQVVRSQRGS